MKSFSEDKTAPEKYKHDFGCKEIERKKIVEQAYPVGYVGAFKENPNENEVLPGTWEKISSLWKRIK